MMRNRLFRLGAAVAAAGVVLSMSACAPGPSGDTAAPSPTNEASKDGFEFQLEPGPPVVQRIFELAAVNDTLPWRRQD